MNIGQRITNILIGVDQLLWILVTLGGGYPDETISSAAWRYEQKGKIIARIARPIIDLLFFWDPQHCYTSYLAEIERRQAPRRPEDWVEQEAVQVVEKKIENDTVSL